MNLIQRTMAQLLTAVAEDNERQTPDRVNWNRPTYSKNVLRVSPCQTSSCRSFGLRRKLIVYLLLGACLVPLGGCQSVPQVLTDESVFKELDALYTAVTARQKNLLHDCRIRLTKLNQEGRLSETGFKTVADIITEAENDRWSDAAQHLYDFMRAQRKIKKSS